MTGCHACGVAIASAFSRRDVCHARGADVRVCRNCRFFDPKAAHACAEPIAEPVTAKERANFCEYFHPEDSRDPRGCAARTSVARAALDELFRKT